MAKTISLLVGVFVVLLFDEAVVGVKVDVMSVQNEPLWDDYVKYRKHIQSQLEDKGCPGARLLVVD